MTAIDLALSTLPGMWTVEELHLGEPQDPPALLSSYFDSRAPIRVFCSAVRLSYCAIVI